MRQFKDHVMGRSQAGGAGNTVATDARLETGDVFADGAIKETRILGQIPGSPR
jgi:hypothetical protein